MAKKSCVMLKVSGEQLGSEENNFDIVAAERVCKVVETLRRNDYLVGCVMGGGNIIRGKSLAENGFENQVVADHMGLRATILNGEFLNEMLRQRGVAESRLFTNFAAEELEDFSVNRALKSLKLGRVVLIAGGLGKPGFTTDSGVVQAAFELGCPTVVKTTKVDGVYDKDPMQHTDATRYQTLTYEDVFANPNIQVMDRTAMDMAAERGITIAVCKPDPSDVLAVLGGSTLRGTIISSRAG